MIQQLSTTHALHSGLYHIKICTGVIKQRIDATPDAYVILELGRRNKLLGISVSVAWPPPHLHWEGKQNNIVRFIAKTPY